MIDYPRFNNILVQLFCSNFGFLFLDFPRRRLAVTFDVQIDLILKHN